MCFIRYVIMLAAICQDAEVDIEKKFAEEGKAAQEALIQKGAVASDISFYHRRDDLGRFAPPPTRPWLQQLDIFPESCVQGSDLKLLDRFQYVNGIRIYDRRFADSDFEVFHRMAGNRLGDDAPEEFKQFLGLVPGTASLELHSETLTDGVIQHVAALKHLQTLDLEGQYSVDALTALAELKELEHLTIRSVSPRNLNTTEYGRYDANLQRSWKQPVMFPPSLTSLEVTDLSVTDDDLAGLANVKGLKGLGLRGALIHGPGLAHLKGLPIESLRLDQCRLDDDALTYLEELPIRSLSLSGCGLNDDTIVDLPPFPGLSEQYSTLSLSHNHLTYMAIEDLPDNVYILRLDHNPISEWADQGRKRFNNLVYLDLSSTFVNDRIFSEMDGIPKLISLDLRRTQITGEGAEVLAGTTIENLILDFCPVTAKGLNKVCQIKQLTGLSLNGIRLTKKQLEEIGESLPNLGDLSIVGCGLTDDEIDVLRQGSLSQVRFFHSKFDAMQPIKAGYVTPPAGGKLGNFPPGFLTPKPDE